MDRTADEYRRYRWAREKRHSAPYTDDGWDIRAHEDLIKLYKADHDVDEVDAQWGLAMMGLFAPSYLHPRGEHEQRLEMDKQQDHRADPKHGDGLRVRSRRH